MDEKRNPIPLGLAFHKAPPPLVEAGAEFSFSVLPAWPEGVTPKGATYVLRDGEKTLQAGELPEPAAEDGVVAFRLTAPVEVGDQRWSLAVASGPNEKGKPAEGSLILTFATIPHPTSLAVWDNPSPVVRGARFEVKVGAKCSSACGLSGAIVEIRDEAGKLMGSAALNDATWPGTAALYWTSVPLKAPRKLKLHDWKVGFAPAGLNLPHDGATSRFSFVAVPEHEHLVSVKVVDKTTKAPVANAQVRMGLYRAVTNETGSAKLHVPAGEFELIVTRAGYRMPERNIDVSKDVRLRIAAEALPEEDPFASWTA